MDASRLAPSTESAVTFGLTLAEAAVLADPTALACPIVTADIAKDLAVLWPDLNLPLLAIYTDIAARVGMARWEELGRLPAGTQPCQVLRGDYAWPGDIVRHLHAGPGALWTVVATCEDGMSIQRVYPDSEEDAEPIQVSKDGAIRFLRCQDR